MTALDRRALVLYICVAVSVAFVDHRVRRERFREHVVTEYIPSVIAGTSGAPAKYRVLMPYVLDGVARRTRADRYVLFLLSEFVFVAASLMVTHAYLRQWHSASAAAGGTFALAALMPLTFTNTWAHPDTFPDLFLFTAGCLAVVTRRDVLLAAILFVGMFNRETMGFLALLWARHRFPEWRQPQTSARAVVIFGVGAAVYIGLRWARGFEHYEMWMLSQNLESMKVLPAGFDPYTRIAGFFWLILVGVPGSLAFTAARQPGSPPFFRHAFEIAALFVVVAWLFAAIIETRVFLPVLPLLLPAATAAFAEPHDRVGLRWTERQSNRR
jgi:hypothetical protein